jgi:hypothetical protein
MYYFNSGVCFGTVIAKKPQADKAIWGCFGATRLAMTGGFGVVIAKLALQVEAICGLLG